MNILFLRHYYCMSRLILVFEHIFSPLLQVNNINSHQSTARKNCHVATRWASCRGEACVAGGPEAGRPGGALCACPEMMGSWVTFSRGMNTIKRATEEGRLREKRKGTRRRVRGRAGDGNGGGVKAESIICMCEYGKMKPIILYSSCALKIKWNEWLQKINF